MVRGSRRFQASDQAVGGIACSGVLGVIVYQGRNGEHGGPIGLIATHQSEVLYCSSHWFFLSESLSVCG